METRLESHSKPGLGLNPRMGLPTYMTTCTHTWEVLSAIQPHFLLL